MTDNLVPNESQASLTNAMNKLDGFEPFKDELHAGNTHELICVHEAKHIIQEGIRILTIHR